MYDYIIIGAGSAGCVLANRLSADPNTQVLLLEAGGADQAKEIHIPAAFSKLFKTAYDWAYYTEAQAHLNNRKLYWPRGKMLGGSSSMNAMIYMRGNRQNYDQWEQLGNEGWGFAEVLPYFKKAQNQERGASEYHGADGPLNVADLRTVNPLSHAFVAAGAELGYPRNDDFNGPAQEGFGLYQVTQKRGKRNSTAAAYLKPALKRANLTVQTNAHATHLLFEKNRAVGVAYVQNGQSQQARASREVLLSGGAINSPHLLLLSGIGPADHLKALGIAVAMDLPGVGQNLQDHLATGVAYVCTQPISLANAEQLGNVLTYLLFQKGPLSSNVAEAGGFVKISADARVPDLQFHFGPVYFMEHGFRKLEGHGFSIGPTLLYPKSRGHIQLHSNDPFAPPAIQPNYFAHEADLKALVEGMKLARRLGATKAFAPYCGGEAAPGAQLQSDAEIAEAIRANVETLYHPVGTCKMGNDPLAVVDAQLRVHGMEGLRVVDASIMPTIVGGNTNAPTILIAEKAAEMIITTG